MRELTVAKNPCATCPYRKDVPSGVWSHEEYEKLRKYDAEPMPSGENLGVFLCHNTPRAGDQVACKGWVMVHGDSIAVRIAQIRGQLGDSAFAETDVPLHESGTAAANFGQRRIKRPGRKAREAMAKLAKTGKFKT